MKPLLVIATFKTEAGEIEARLERTMDGEITAKAQHALIPWTLVRDYTGGGPPEWYYGAIGQREWEAALPHECPLDERTKDAMRAATRAMLAWVV